MCIQFILLLLLYSIHPKDREHAALIIITTKGMTGILKRVKKKIINPVAHQLLLLLFKTLHTHCHSLTRAFENIIIITISFIRIIRPTYLYRRITIMLLSTTVNDPNDIWSTGTAKPTECRKYYTFDLRKAINQIYYEIIVGTYLYIRVGCFSSELGVLV